jgi:hypothetical protein
MLQGHLFRNPSLVCIGPVQEGYTNAMMFQDEARMKYIGKYDNGERPFIHANELIAGRLASRVGLNAPRCLGVRPYQSVDYIIMDWVFGSKKFLEVVHWYDIRATFSNLEKFRLIYCFDFWIGNIDRSLANLLVVMPTTDSDPDVWLIDHERSLLDRGPEVQGLMRTHAMLCEDVVNLTFRDIVEQSYRSREDFGKSVEMIQMISDQDIRDAVYTDTDEMFTGKDFRVALVETLKERRGRLNTYIDCLFQRGGLSAK